MPPNFVCHLKILPSNCVTSFKINKKSFDARIKYKTEKKNANRKRKGKRKKTAGSRRRLAIVAANDHPKPREDVQALRRLHLHHLRGVVRAGARCSTRSRRSPSTAAVPTSPSIHSTPSTPGRPETPATLTVSSRIPCSFSRLWPLPLELEPRWATVGRRGLWSPSPLSSTFARARATIGCGSPRASRRDMAPCQNDRRSHRAHARRRSASSPACPARATGCKPARCHWRVGQPD